ncbi:MAG: hypothetical protein SCALA702_26810 [Melioribacteraceae bacterium]|nr:MAG: hypothetical protein SCALA702_26810 [Melioribacteraceae bacterium]
MALLNSLFSGISGLKNHQTMMDVIGNNVANANTIGFKSSRITFSDTFNQLVKAGTNPNENSGGTNSFQVGLGVKVNSIDRNWSQGTFERTGIITDLGLQGPGMFILKNNGQEVYARAGAFTFDSDGKLVNPQNGAIVQGKVANDDGVIPPGNNLEDIQINTNLKLPAVATTEVNWGGNLDANSYQTRTELVKIKGNIKDDLDPAQLSDIEVEPVTIYNDYGQEFELHMHYVETSDNNFDLTWTVVDPAVEDATSSYGYLEIGSDTITGLSFDANGELVDPTLVENINVTILSFGGQDYDINFDFDAATVTRTTAPESLSALADDGRDPNIVKASITIYDSLGNPHEATLQFTKAGSESERTWYWRISVPEASRQPDDPEYFSGTLKFNSDGSLDPTDTPNLHFVPQSGADPVNIKLDFGNGFKGLTQTVGSSTLSALNQDGAPAASLTNLNIDQFGNVEGIFSNGNTKTLAQIMVATFKNLNGMVSVGDNLFVPRANTGEAFIGNLGEDTSTTLQSGALEQSNVDLSDEFTKMIISQRGFQANARVISTSDNILQEITNLVR